MIYFLDDTFLGITNYSCAKSPLFPVFEAIKFAIVVVQIAVPFALIIWGSLDWFKALIAHDEKEMRMKRKPFIKRVVAALLVLCLPWLVQLVSNIIADNDKSNSFWTCYSEAKARVDFKSWDDTSWFTDDDEDGTLKAQWETIQIQGNNGNTGGSTNPNQINGLPSSGSSNSGGIESLDDQINSISSSIGETAQQYVDTAINSSDTSGSKKNNDKRHEHSSGNTEQNTKSRCTDLGDNCRKTDDYGAACEPNQDHTCGYKHNPVSCDQITVPEECRGKEDDYGNKCDWGTEDSHSAHCYSTN